MLPFITPFELVTEKIGGREVTSLVYEDVNVNHNTIRPATVYEICNNTDSFEADNVVAYSSGHEVDNSKEFQLVFSNHDKVTFIIHDFRQCNDTTYLLLSSTVLFHNVLEFCTINVS